MRAIPTPWGELNDMVWSPDGALLACAADDGAVHLIDVPTGTQIASLGDHDVDEVTAVDFAPGGSVIASTDLSSTVYLWSPKTGAPLAQLAHEAGGHFLAYGPDAKTLIAAGQGDAIAVIDLEAMRVGAELESPAGDILHTAISRDRSTLAAFTAHDRVVVWDLATREVRASLRSAELHGSTCLAVAPDGRAVILGRADGRLTRWSLPADVLAGERQAHDGPVRFVTFSPDGELIASCGPDQLVRAWEALELSPAGYRPMPGRPGLMAFAPDGKTLAVDDGAGELRLWSPAQDTIERVSAD
jgi:WD40 repeat protein